VPRDAAKAVHGELSVIIVGFEDVANLTNSLFVLILSAKEVQR